jgi:hypothetical protein
LSFIFPSARIASLRRAAYLYGIILRMMPELALAAIADCRRLLLRFGDFPESRWPLYALFRLTFPAPVKSKRFFDELCDFNFGIYVPPIFR